MRDLINGLSESCEKYQQLLDSGAGSAVLELAWDGIHSQVKTLKLQEEKEDENIS